MPLLGILLTMGFLLILVAMGFYIAVIGRLGIQFFKYNFPLSKKRGTHYLILQRNGRFKWVYDRFKSVWVWPDKTKSFISKNFDRLAQSAEPLVFLVEGYPTNAMLAEQLPPEEMSRLVNNIIKEVETTSRLEAEISEKGTVIMDKIVPIMTMGFAAVGALVGIVVVMNLGEISEQVTWAINTMRTLQPQVIEAIAAVKDLPRQI